MRKTLLALTASLVLAACGGGGPTTEEDGEGAIYSSPHASWGVDQSTAKVGQTWSAGSVLLCRVPGSDAVPTISSVVPVKVTGAVVVDGIGVRTAHYAPSDGVGEDTEVHIVGTMHGKPTNLQTPDGYVVPTDCEDVKGPVGEIVVTLTKTGDADGALDGLRVAYTVDDDDERHVFDIAFHFGFKAD